MIKLLAIGFGGFLGAIGRYLVGGVAHRFFPGSFPIGTLVVNLIGCFLLGSIMYLVESSSSFTPNFRLFLSVGLLGAFTTFSTFGYETMQLYSSHQINLAFLNIAGNLLLGLFAVWLGRVVVRILGM